MDITAIIQARMGSSRLPGKILKEVCGKPLLYHQVERVKNCKLLSQIIIATSDQAQDDPVAELGQLIDCPVFRGSENDVLDRFYQAALQYDAKIIMRLTGDCPLLDPHVCDQLIRLFLKSGVNLAHTGQSFAEGLDCEILDFPTLKKAWENAALPMEREHCTLYVYNHNDAFSIETLENERDDSRYRFTVDEEADFQVVRTIFEHFFKVGKPLPYMDDIRAFLDNCPEVMKLNSHVIRNEGLINSQKENSKID